MEPCRGQAPDTMEWWKKTIIYQVYPRSFQDSRGDGIGDIPGIISRLNHFTETGIGAIWLSPFYPSPQLDFGYDISDFCEVDPQYGTLDDFDTLIKQAHKRDIKVIIDFVPGHSSHLHPWFEKSVKREDPYTDYYVWHDGKLDQNGRRVPPNNWLSVFGGTAWSWCEERGQFYYRPFIPEQPKLNFRCPHLVEEMKNVVRFWLGRGADGMRVDAVVEIMEAADKFLDEPRNMAIDCPPDQHDHLLHIYTGMQPEGFELIKGWSDVIKEYEKKDGQSRFMIIETYVEGRNIYRDCGGLPFNMDLVDKLEDKGLSGTNVRKLVDEEYSNLPPGAWPTFVLGNHDRHRVKNKYGDKFGDALNILLLTLKGTPTTYYGEEIGMEDISVTYEETQDPWGRKMGPGRYLKYSRDPCRSPMQWDNTHQAGFSTSEKTWLPVHPKYKMVNVKNQGQSSGPLSSLKIYKTVASLRHQPVFLCGGLAYSLCNQDIFSYIRYHPDYPDRYLVALNLGLSPYTGNYTASPVSATEGQVVVSSTAVDPSMAIGKAVKLDGITLKPGDAVVIHLAQ